MTMNKNHQKLMNALRPITYISQITGITFPNHIQTKKLKLITIYRIIVLSLLTLALLREIPTMMFWSRNLNGVHGMLAFIETRLRWFAVFINFLLTVFNNTNINKTLIKLMNSPIILKQEVYSKILKCQILVIAFTTSLMASFMILGHDFLWINPYYAWYTSTIYIITESYIGFANIQFVILLFVIKKYFKALNENLRKCDFRLEAGEKRDSFAFFVITDHKQDNITEIVKFRQIHMNLTSACWRANQCFSLQILLIFWNKFKTALVTATAHCLYYNSNTGFFIFISTLLFIQILLFLTVSLVEVTYSLRALTIYSIKSDNPDTNNWKNKPTLEGLLICTWGGYYLWSIFQIIFSCETTIVESNKASGVVHDLLNKIPDKDVQEQLQIFSLQLMNYQVFFTAGKFVTLNFSLLNSIIGTITTYLVIIMTFSV